MPDYKTMYHTTFNAITDAERLVSQAAAILQTAQQKTEDLLVEADDTPIELKTKDDLPKNDE